ncbi:hypothetical protein ACXR2U_21750 [Jatrophihabitans sp. YIM 134969]
MTPSPTGWLGGRPLLADAERWRVFATRASTDLESMRAAVVGLRRQLAELDIGTTMRVLGTMSESSHAFARMVQADHEAVQALTAAGLTAPDDSVVLFASNGGAVRASVDPRGGWVLNGTQARSVHPAAAGWALVPATTSDGEALFLVRLDAPGVTVDRTPPRVIAPEDPNGPVSFTAVEATAVGTAETWAARARRFDGLLLDTVCWFGACVWLCRTVEATLATPTERDDLERVGRVDTWVFAARLALRDAAEVVQADPSGPAAELAARRAQAVTATTIDTVIRLIALLSDARTPQDPDLPHRVAQLQIVLRRFDADANLRAIARLVGAGATPRRVRL